MKVAMLVFMTPAFFNRSRIFGADIRTAEGVTYETKLRQEQNSNISSTDITTAALNKTLSGDCDARHLVVVVTMLPFTGCLQFRQWSRQEVRWNSVSTDCSCRVHVEQKNSGIHVSVIGSGESTGVYDAAATSEATRDQGLLTDEDKILLSTMDTRSTRPLITARFLTIQRRRKRRTSGKPRSCQRTLLDDTYHGPVQLILDRIGEWRFNAFTLDTITGGRSVPVMCTHLFHELGLLSTFRLDVIKVWKFFNLIEEGYHRTNPYHNGVHATDVTQAMFCFLRQPKISEYLTPLEAMSAILAAVSHDLDHPGVNQPFLIATSNHLAALYGNASVLENHHWRMAVGCMSESGILDDLTQNTVHTIMAQVRSLILATDIARQTEFLAQFKNYMESRTLSMELAEHRHFILQIALKCADISNPCRFWDISRKWSKKVCDEFYRQGDFERRLKLPLTSLCDRNSSSVSKIQVGFFRHVVRPLYVEWNRWLGTPLAADMARNLEVNQVRWERSLQRELDEEACTEYSLDGMSEARASIVADTEDSVSVSELRELLTLPRHSSRRHSAPVIVPTPVARTFIRRDSMPAPGMRRLRTDTILHRTDGTSERLRLPEADGDAEDTWGSEDNAATTCNVSIDKDEEDSDCGGTAGGTGTGDLSELSTDMLLPQSSIASIIADNSPSPLAASSWSVLPRMFTPTSIDDNEQDQDMPRCQMTAPTTTGNLSPQVAAASGGGRYSLPEPAAAAVLLAQQRGRYLSLPVEHKTTGGRDPNTVQTADLLEVAIQQQQQQQQNQQYSRRMARGVQSVTARHAGVHARRGSAPAIQPTSSLLPPSTNTSCIVRNSSFSEGMKQDQRKSSMGLPYASTLGLYGKSGDFCCPPLKAGDNWRSTLVGAAIGDALENRRRRQQISRLRVALLLQLRAALSFDGRANKPPPVSTACPPTGSAHRRGSLPTDLITICSPR